MTTKEYNEQCKKTRQAMNIANARPTSIRDRALTKQGRFSSLTWEKECKVYKNAPKITKKTYAHSVRIGASYDNLKDTKEKRAIGDLPIENQGLKGCEWVKYPIILKSIKTNQEMLRIETTRRSSFNSKYFMNGKEVTYNEVEQYLQASEKRNGSLPSVINVKLDNIIDLR